MQFLGLLLVSSALALPFLNSFEDQEYSVEQYFEPEYYEYELENEEAPYYEDEMDEEFISNRVPLFQMSKSLLTPLLAESRALEVRENRNQQLLSTRPRSVSPPPPPTRPRSDSPPAPPPPPPRSNQAAAAPPGSNAAAAPPAIRKTGMPYFPRRPMSETHPQNSVPASGLGQSVKQGLMHAVKGLKLAQSGPERFGMRSDPTAYSQIKNAVQQQYPNARGDQRQDLIRTAVNNYKSNAEHSVAHNTRNAAIAVGMAIGENEITNNYVPRDMQAKHLYDAAKNQYAGARQAHREAQQQFGSGDVPPSAAVQGLNDAARLGDLALRRFPPASVHNSAYMGPAPVPDPSQI